MVMTTVVSGRHAVPVSESVEPEVSERATRRVFSPQYKLRILEELLIEEIYKVRPPHGVVVLAGGPQERVAFTPALEHRLLATMQGMRELVARIASSVQAGSITSVGL